jgi:type II secretory pathway pseudopilin PulG
MAASLPFCGFRRNALRSPFRRRRTKGASLLETLIVLSIIGIMASMLFPALQAARRKAKGSECQNNARQLGMALAQCIHTLKRFPAPNRWTVDILKWIEEEPLARQIASGIPPNAELLRPTVYRCEEQAEVGSKVPNVFVCHYVLAVDRPTSVSQPERTPWEISDRPYLNDKGKGEAPYDPWYVGTEINLTEQRIMFDTMEGPHPGGSFYTSNGQLRGGK